jgi:uncharacterized protein
MQLIEGSPVFCATDLVGYLTCEHLTGLELAGAPDGSIEDRLEQLRSAAAETEAATRRDDDIFQATFFDGRWRGHADFLLRVEVPSDLGAWSHEVADTKLTRHVKIAGPDGEGTAG